MNEDEQVQNQGFVVGTPGEVGPTYDYGWLPTVGPSPKVNNTAQKEELYLREKSIEYTIQAVGFKEVDLPVFTAMLDYFYNYLKTGTTIKV